MKYTHKHEGKITYYSEGEAREVLRRGVGKRIYTCYIGGNMHWHLTSKNKKSYKESATKLAL